MRNREILLQWITWLHIMRLGLHLCSLRPERI